MTPPVEPSAAIAGKPAGAPHPRFPITTRFGLALLALLVGFSWPLYDLVRYSLQSDLYSHIVLIPFISLYLGWTQRQALPLPTAPNRRLAGGLLGAGVLTLGGYWIARSTGTELAREDALALLVVSFLSFFTGLCGWFLDRATMRALAFPMGFLVFMAPFPIFVTEGIETFLQHTSAAAANVFFQLSGTTVFHHDLIFQLPGITLQVAPECSGIHSSLALFITSVLAGQIFLRSPWKRTVLAAAVIPLAILRNGFRIFTIGELCVHISPDMINSYIHRHGGPVFFVLSLIPFFFLLRFLYKSDHPNQSKYPRGKPRDI